MHIGWSWSAYVPFCWHCLGRHATLFVWDIRMVIGQLLIKEAWKQAKEQGPWSKRALLYTVIYFTPFIHKQEQNGTGTTLLYFKFWHSIYFILYCSTIVLLTFFCYGSFLYILTLQIMSIDKWQTQQVLQLSFVQRWCLIMIVSLTRWPCFATVPWNLHIHWMTGKMIEEQEQPFMKYGTKSSRYHRFS